MDRFVRVRLVKANGLDLTQFQFDFDLTFAAFFLNADGTVYGRFGSRSSRPEAMRDMSMESFGAAMTAALELHKDYPNNRAALAGKRPTDVQFKTPDDFPALRGRYQPQLEYKGAVVASCMHCHQIRDAERTWYREQSKPVPDTVLYPWPIPDVIGLRLDGQSRATVAEVAVNTPGARAGFRPGDALLTLNGQPLISIADVQWILHNAQDPARLQATFRRDGQTHNAAIDLDRGWRRKTDIAWRVSTWDLRRMTTGGLVLEDVTKDDRESLGLANDSLALRIRHVGQYGDHAVAKRAGFEKDDVVVQLDGRTDAMTETAWIAHVLKKHMPGAAIDVTVLREGRRVNLKLPVQ